PADPPNTRDCGQCRICLDACPTDALPEPFILDANRCISYLTIEHKGNIAPELRQHMGDRIFGCDICQEVCPWNTVPEGADHPELRLPEARRELDLAGLLRLSRDEYVERFRGSPMKRAKLEGLQRNAAVAMGNRRHPRYVAPLAEALAEGEPVVRAHAAWALGRMATPEALQALEEAWAREQDQAVREEIQAARGVAAAASVNRT
ncbi:MAG TPA: 4Fe-4S double cluster binding domain-containing protein, partial [Thermoanaerobaculia bacterium]|nr:4Fe-4S double cluster binding domain-containing protein [Thermoanaerobaculia bacterium]